ncbi:hypothetical protein HOLleu_23125 [Holothuria leucospilota]|uniref:Uncharacterized protein n=1 Tax=Holothuria leucospilota TaxID=206669 RepID=A0A9Q1BUI0_HOLLE|nr:hypothetical protein HOLleu_23125 [Holothuria leucospilota]
MCLNLFLIWEIGHLKSTLLKNGISYHFHSDLSLLSALLNVFLRLIFFKQYF